MRVAASTASAIRPSRPMGRPRQRSIRFVACRVLFPVSSPSPDRAHPRRGLVRRPSPPHETPRFIPVLFHLSAHLALLTHASAVHHAS